MAGIKYLSIHGLRKGPGKFLTGVLESPGKVLDLFSSERVETLNSSTFLQFTRINGNTQHLLYRPPPPECEHHYTQSLNQRSHNFQLPDRTSILRDKNLAYRRSAPESIRPGRSAPRPPQTRSIRPNFWDDPPQVLGRSAPIKLHQI